MGIPTTVLIGLAERLVDRLWDNDRAKKAVSLLEEIAELSRSVSRMEEKLAAIMQKKDLSFAADNKKAEVSDSTREQTLLAQSPRLGGLKIPAGLNPTIEVTKWSRWGKIEYSSTVVPGGKKVPKGYGFDVITTDGTNTDDHMGGYCWQDSRWNKHYRNKLRSFMVVLRHDEKGIVEYSRVIDAEA